MRGFFTMMGGLRHLCDEKFLIMGGLEGQKMQPIILFITTMRRNDIHHNVVTIYSFFSDGWNKKRDENTNATTRNL